MTLCANPLTAAAQDLQPTEPTPPGEVAFPTRKLGLGPNIEFRGNSDVVTLAFPVPAGNTPAFLDTTAELPTNVARGWIDVVSDGRLLTRVELPPGGAIVPLTIPLAGAKVENGAAVVSLDLHLVAVDNICPDDWTLGSVRLRDGVVRYAGTPAAPQGVADYLPPEGALFVNGDDDLLPTLRDTCGHKVVTFGLGPGCDWRATGLNEADKGTFFTCAGPGGEKIEMFVPAAGQHNVRNALASMAVARYLGVPAQDAVRAIAAYKAPAMRQQILETGGLTLIDDSYNASPDSMRSAIDVLAGRDVPGKRAAVLADMLELGDYASQGHFEVGQYAKEKGVDLLIAVGPLSKDIAAGFGKEAKWFATNAEAIACLKEHLVPGDAVLVKGSRGMHAEEIAAALKGETDT